MVVILVMILFPAFATWRRGWVLEPWDSHNGFGLKCSQVPGHQLCGRSLSIAYGEEKMAMCIVEWQRKWGGKLKNPSTIVIGTWAPYSRDVKAKEGGQLVAVGPFPPAPSPPPKNISASFPSSPSGRRILASLCHLIICKTGKLKQILMAFFLEEGRKIQISIRSLDIPFGPELWTSQCVDTGIF